jgi:hypothetical protein
VSYTNTFFEERLDQLFDLAALVEKAFHAAGIDYRVVGGLAAYLYVEEAQPDAGRLTRDIDILVCREDLEKITRAVKPWGLSYRNVAGVDMLIQLAHPGATRAVHLLFTGEKVRPECSEAAPEITSGKLIRGMRLAPLADLVRMKLTSFRAKDEAHLKDLDEAGLITLEIEEGLPAILRDRLAHMRARD